jgi:hypothetical protein
MSNAIDVPVGKPTNNFKISGNDEHPTIYRNFNSDNADRGHSPIYIREILCD